MTSLEQAQEPTRCHLSINVADLNKSIAFYRVLFGMEPTKRHDDYAKFDVANPPTVFSLVPWPAGHGGPMSHLGLRLTREEDVRAIQSRLDAAGIVTREQNNTRGCYAVQTKVWVEDPDQNLWEVYVVYEDIPQGDITGACMSASVFDGLADDGEERLLQGIRARVRR